MNTVFGDFGLSQLILGNFGSLHLKSPAPLSFRYITSTFLNKVYGIPATSMRGVYYTGPESYKITYHQIQSQKATMHKYWQNNNPYGNESITAYLLLRVNLDKIMHVRWDFDASSVLRTRRVSALDKHQNWSASALFCLNFRAQSKYAVVNLIHTRRKQTFWLLYVVNKTF